LNDAIIANTNILAAQRAPVIAGFADWRNILREHVIKGVMKANRVETFRLA
jgi:hypothetical protein